DRCLGIVNSCGDTFVTCPYCPVRRIAYHGTLQKCRHRSRSRPMPLVPLRKLLDHAAENNYGVAAFNVNNMEQIQSIMEAAKETDSPVIIQASRGARAYSQDNYLKHLMLAAAELYPQIPTVMHQDHGNSPATCASAIENNFTSVMMDGS